jgi:hypothetical protein
MFFFFVENKILKEKKVWRCLDLLHPSALLKKKVIKFSTSNVLA